MPPQSPTNNRGFNNSLVQRSRVLSGRTQSQNMSASIKLKTNQEESYLPEVNMNSTKVIFLFLYPLRQVTTLQDRIITIKVIPILG